MLYFVYYQFIESHLMNTMTTLYHVTHSQAFVMTGDLGSWLIIADIVLLTIAIGVFALIKSFAKYRHEA